MAKKNPKRVAAGKKAARTRAKGKGRRRSSGGNPGRSAKRHTRGISGRIGAVILGVAPPALAGIEAASAAMNSKKVHNLTGLATLQVGFNRWLNNLTNGFLGTIPFQEMTYAKEGGGTVTFNTGAGLPKGSLWSVAGVGLLMMAYDFAASKLAGNRAIKIPMTGIAATGSS